ncbi:MAG: helix-turn-helix domain-containing protein [Deltaproteobacteria bacterium]|nr:helix-turn-helix domain-containing protein [Deltaproteobacteria bacterium]
MTILQKFAASHVFQRTSIRRYIKTGKIPAYNFGKEYKFKISELTDFVDSTRVNGKVHSPKTG